jgi:hypothetical protein
LRGAPAALDVARAADAGDLALDRRRGLGVEGALLLLVGRIGAELHVRVEIVAVRHENVAPVLRLDDGAGPEDWSEDVADVIREFRPYSGDREDDTLRGPLISAKDTLPWRKRDCPRTLLARGAFGSPTKNSYDRRR